MRNTKFTKPTAKLELTEKPYNCCEMFHELCIAHIITKALRDSRHSGLAKRFGAEYKKIVNDSKFDFFSFRIGELYGYLYFSEFFKLANNYVELIMTDDFKKYAYNSDEERRRAISEKPYYLWSQKTYMFVYIYSL